MTLDELKKLNVEQLKAMAFDHRQELDRVQNNLQILMGLIQEKMAGEVGAVTEEVQDEVSE